VAQQEVLIGHLSRPSLFAFRPNRELYWVWTAEAEP